MSEIRTRWAVVIIARHLEEQHLPRHREIDYVAKVITNTIGAELTESGRNYVFGGTINEVDFYEVASEEIARRLASKFNENWSSKKLCQKLNRLTKHCKES